MQRKRSTTSPTGISMLRFNHFFAPTFRFSFCSSATRPVYLVVPKCSHALLPCYSNSDAKLDFRRVGHNLVSGTRAAGTEERINNSNCRSWKWHGASEELRMLSQELGSRGSRVSWVSGFGSLGLRACGIMFRV